MDDGIFQWDDDKATLNAAKYAVTFESARRAFDNPFAIDWMEIAKTMAKNGIVCSASPMSGFYL